MDKIEIPCPGCSRQLRLAESQREKQVRCPTCKTVFVVRAPKQETAKSGPADVPPQKTAPETSRAGSPKPAKSPGPKPSAPVPSARERRAARQAARRAAAPKSSTASRAKAPPAQVARGSQPAGRKRPESQPRPVSNSDDYDDPYTDEDIYADDNIEDYDDPFGGDAPYGYDDYNSAPQRKKKKRRSSGNAGQIVAIAVAIIVAVGAVSGLGFVAWKFIPGLGGNVVDLSYMPEDTAGFVRINVASVTRSALFRDRIAANPMSLQSIEQLEQQAGMKLSEIDTVTFGFRTGGMGNSPFGGLSAASGAGLIVVRTRTAIPASLLESHPAGSSTAENHNGATIYSLNGRYAWMPDSRTVVIGRREEVVAVIDSNGKQHRFPQFDFASSGYDILIVGEPNATGSAFSAPVGLSLQQEAKGIALGVNLSSGAEVAFQVNCNSRAQARASVQKSEEERSQARQNFDRQMARSPFVNQEMSSAVKQLIDEVSISSSGSVLTMKVSIGKDMIDKFVSMIPGM